MQPWWQRAVFYQAYVRSFADSNGDGVGDLRGVIDRLGYLESLGIDALWLSPVTVSPDKDWGYDVSDYYDVQPALGTLDDVDELIADAGRRGIRIVLDLVPNHTSDRHAWFREARGSRAAPRRDWYVWADAPNNWKSAFGGGPAWTLDSASGQYYLHSFLPEQVDLNWWNEDVRGAFDEIFRFWLDRGVAGFRLDVAHAIVKERTLRDRGEGEDDVLVDLDETYAVQRRWRALADRYDTDRVLLGETWVMDLDRLARFYGDGTNQLHLAFNFPFTFADFTADALRGVVERTEEVIPKRAWPVWTLSNHDIVRFPTRMCGGDRRKVRCALLALLTLRGTPVLYYGDELGLAQVEIAKEVERDIAGRDGARTPMPWNGEWNEPWLPLDRSTSVEAQDGDPGSILELARELIRRRRASDDLLSGAYRSLDAPDGVWAYARGEGTTVALNLSDAEASFAGERLEPWQGVLVQPAGSMRT